MHARRRPPLLERHPWCSPDDRLYTHGGRWPVVVVPQSGPFWRTSMTLVPVSERPYAIIPRQYVRGCGFRFSSRSGTSARILCTLSFVRKGGIGSGPGILSESRVTDLSLRIDDIEMRSTHARETVDHGPSAIRDACVCSGDACFVEESVVSTDPHQVLCSGLGRMAAVGVRPPIVEGISIKPPCPVTMAFCPTGSAWLTIRMLHDAAASRPNREFHSRKQRKSESFCNARAAAILFCVRPAPIRLDALA